ncbi:MAG: alpha/beta fold hydrolase [Pseudomonadota bacterium]
MDGKPIQISARDNYPLAATVYLPSGGSNKLVLINSATAVPRGFYEAFAKYVTDAGFTALTYDYRGIAESKPNSLRGFKVTMRDWAAKDMAAVVDYVCEKFEPHRLFMIGHSVGGQVAGLLDNSDKITAMTTYSAQSGYWGFQGGEQKWVVAVHVYFTLPLLARLLGYMPWSWFSSAEDLPKGVALEWSRWCRDSKYLLGDDSLPLERYRNFTAPVMAYSFSDDKWGTPRSVDAMMSAYPNLQRRHFEPEELGLKSIGHFGFFRRGSERLWQDTIDWFNSV